MQNIKMLIPIQLRSKKLFRYIPLPCRCAKDFLIHCGYWLKCDYFSTQGLDRSWRQYEKAQALKANFASFES